MHFQVLPGLESSATHDAYIVFVHIMLSQSMGVPKTLIIASSAYVMGFLQMVIQVFFCLVIRWFGAITTKLVVVRILNVLLFGTV